MQIAWDDLEGLEDYSLPLTCHLDLRTGRFVEDPSEHTVPFLGGVHPREDESDAWGAGVYDPRPATIVRCRHQAMKLRACRDFASRLADRALATRLLRVLDAEGSPEQAEGFALVVTQARREDMKRHWSEIPARVHAERETRRLALVPKPHWYTDDDQMVELRERTFGAVLRQVDPHESGEYNESVRLAWESDIWTWACRHAEDPGTPRWLDKVLRWRQDEVARSRARVAGLLERLERRLIEREPEIVGVLRAGAGGTRLEALERELGTAIPAEVRQLLAWHDGGAVIMPVAYGFSLLSCDQIGEVRARLVEAFADDPSWWNPAWIPLLEDPSGNLIVLDPSGTYSGVENQLLVWWHDAHDRQLLAYDLEGWLDVLLALFDGKAFVPDEHGIDEVSFRIWNQHARHRVGSEMLELEARRGG